MMNASILNGFASLESCFQDLMMASAIGSVLVLLAIAFHAASSKWISATWLYALWFVVLFRFILFAAPESPTSLLNIVAQPAATTSIIEPDVQGFEVKERLIFASDAVVPIPIDEPTASWHWPTLNYWTLAAIAWLVVVFGLLCRLGLGYLSVQRLIRESSEPSSQLLSRFESLKRRLALQQRTRLRVSNALEVPAMAGLLHPIVILPAWCSDELDEEQLEMIFTHELIHIQRRDGLIQLAAHLIVVLHWFNPLARIAARFIESTRELSCDRRVIEIWKKTNAGRAQSGSTAETLSIERKYGRTILDIAGRAHSANNAHQYSAAFIGGFTGSNQNLIKQRIAMLVDSRSQLWLRNIVAAGFVSLLLAVGFTSAQTVCPPCPPGSVQILPAPALPGTILPMTPIYEGLPIVPAQIVPAQIVPPVVSTTPISALPPDLIFATPESIWTKPNRVEVSRNQSSASAGTTKTEPLPQTKRISLFAGDRQSLTSTFKVPEIQVSDLTVVTASPLSPNEIEFTAVAPGTTEVRVYNQDRKVQLLKFSVVPDVRELKSKLSKAFPGVTARIIPTPDGFVNLVGQVTTEQVAQINEFVVANCKFPVRNQLSDKDPIAINIKVYEVSKTKLKELGVDWPKIGIEKPVESLIELLPGPRMAANNTLGFGIVDGDRFDAFLTSLEKHNIAKLLDQPTLVAYDGRLAEFLSGGEVPITIINENGQRTVEFRSYGTKIHTKPLIHSKEELTLEIRAEVSEIAKDLSSDGVPGFRVRRVNTGIRLKPGETVALMGDYKAPQAGGESSKKQIHGDKESTELVILLTPRLIEKGSEFLTQDFTKGPEFKLSREAAALKKESSIKR